MLCCNLIGRGGSEDPGAGLTTVPVLAGPGGA
jgi:hypothetical protein